MSKPDGLKVPRPIREGFEFRNVSFTYPGTDRTVLRDFNFTLRPGERIALIGENGQGKTTVVKLITRLYDPTEGQILLDGVDLREYSLEDLHRRDRGDLPGFHAVRDDGAGEYRGGPGGCARR